MDRAPILTILAILICCGSSSAQSTPINCTDSTFCIPGVVGLPRSKGLVITRELVKDYAIRSNVDGMASSGEVRRNRRWEMKLRAPVLLKEGFKMAVGFKYFVEEFNFENSDNQDFAFYNSLENRPLRSIRSDVYMIKPTLGKRYYILRVSAGLNGDYNLDNFGKEEFLRFSVTPLIGWKENDYVSWAVGVAYSYSFGRRRIFPILAYNKSFNLQWGIESILPASIKLRYSTKDLKNYFYLKAELNGANYSVRLTDQQRELVYLNKSEIRYLLNYEREIHDWLWFGVEAGLRQNINFDLANSPDINSNVVVENSLNEAFLMNFSLFLVPPRKFLK